MYFLIKWLIGKLRRRPRPRPRPRRRSRFQGPDEPWSARQASTSRAPNRTVAPSAGHDGRGAVRPRPEQAIRRPGRVRGRLLRRRLRRGVRLPRAERRREDDDRADARHADRADLGLGHRRRDPADAGERRRDPPPDRGHARVARPLPAPERGREPRVLRRPVRGARPARRGSTARCGRSTWPTGPATRAARCPRACASGSPWPGRCCSDPQVLFLDEPTSGLDPVAARDVHELIDELRRSGVTIFLTTHRLEEAERLCDRVAILNTTLRTIGRPDELRERLFAKTLTVRTLAPLPEPGRVFAGLPGVDGWRQDGAGDYVLAVSDPARRRARGHPRPGRGGRRRAVDRRVAPLARGRLPRADRRGRGGERADEHQTGGRVRAIFRKELRDYRRNAHHRRRRWRSCR